MALFQASGGVRWLIVCLGNPGARYEGTRHNAGFMTADALAKKLKVSINRARFHALTGKGEIGGESVLLMKPQTYMNLSGEAAAEAAKFYKIPPERVIVVSDETALPIGKLRVRSKGSAGGHNGLKSIIACLGSARGLRHGRLGAVRLQKPGRGGHRPGCRAGRRGRDELYHRGPRAHNEQV